MSNKKRSRKAYTKKSKKLEEEMQGKNLEMISNSEHNRVQQIYGEFAYNSAMDKKSTTNSVRFAQEVEEIGA